MDLEDQKYNASNLRPFCIAHNLLVNILGQNKIEELQGFNNQWYCGAWLGNGFHEAGISSSIKISRNLDGKIPWL